MGETTRVPDAATVPMPWLTDSVVAPDLLHDSVLDAPLAIDAGPAVNVNVGRPGVADPIAQVGPLKPGRVVGVQLLGGRGITDVLGW